MTLTTHQLPLSENIHKEQEMPPITPAQAAAVEEYYEKRKPYNELLLSVLDQTPHHRPKKGPLEFEIPGFPPTQQDDESKGKGKENEKEKEKAKEVSSNSSYEAWYNELMAKLEPYRIVDDKEKNKEANGEAGKGRGKGKKGKGK